MIEGPIGVFDSGYGGLSVLRELVRYMPQSDFMYLGDNARTPYGTRSFDVVYSYTLQAVSRLFEMGCNLVILACNTASAKALRSIQQKDLPLMAPGRRVLGVIRPSVEYAIQATVNGHVGVLATTGTVASLSYRLEIEKLAAGKMFRVTQQACPMWVPIVENGEMGTPGADYFIREDLGKLFDMDPLIDCLILGCTHYPLLIESIRKFIPRVRQVAIVEQGKLVADRLIDYLDRHPEIDAGCSRRGVVQYFTTEQVELFESQASRFMEQPVMASKIEL